MYLLFPVMDTIFHLFSQERVVNGLNNHDMQNVTTPSPNDLDLLLRMKANS